MPDTKIGVRPTITHPSWMCPLKYENEPENFADANMFVFAHVSEPLESTTGKSPSVAFSYPFRPSLPYLFVSMLVSSTSPVDGFHSTPFSVFVSTSPAFASSQNPAIAACPTWPFAFVTMLTPSTGTPGASTHTKPLSAAPKRNFPSVVVSRNFFESPSVVK